MPLTEIDHERLADVLEDSNPKDVLSYIRPLKTGEAKLKAFTHILDKRHDGKCVFLTAENRCWLHAEYGSQAKPAMCQLFPYTFTETPTGVYAAVSFASSGVLCNSGHCLSDQRHLLEKQWELFARLNPDSSPDWSSIQFVDGVPLSWSDYLTLENTLIEGLMVDKRSGGSSDRLNLQLQQKSKFLVESLPGRNDLDNAHLTRLRPKLVDEMLIKELLCLYFPQDVFASSSCEFMARPFLERMMSAAEKVMVVESPDPIDFGELSRFRLGELDLDSDRLLRRFVYLKIFSKLYFGPGLGGLSLLAGFHHLALLIGLIRIKIKVDAISRQKAIGTDDPIGPVFEEVADFEEVAEIVRTLERRLTVSSFSLEATATLEVLLQSPSRLERILSLSS